MVLSRGSWFGWQLQVALKSSDEDMDAPALMKCLRAAKPDAGCLQMSCED